LARLRIAMSARKVERTDSLCDHQRLALWRRITLICDHRRTLATFAAH
jgi:hypothetical protein